MDVPVIQMILMGFGIAAFFTLFIGIYKKTLKLIAGMHQRKT